MGTHYTNASEELLSIINGFTKLDKATVSKLNEDNIAVDYNHNIKTFIMNHLGTNHAPI